MTNNDQPYTEYRVVPVQRYMVTKYEGVRHSNGTESGSSPRQIGNEFASAETAYEVGYALARQEAETKGLMPGDMGVIYPAHPNDVGVVEVVLSNAEMRTVLDALART